jgi:hypothetical protein
MATNNISKGKPKMFIFTPTNCRLRLDQIEHEEDAVCQEANVRRLPCYVCRPDQPDCN